MRARFVAVLLVTALLLLGGPPAGAQFWYGYPWYPYPPLGYGYPYGYPVAASYYPFGGAWPYGWPFGLLPFGALSGYGLLGPGFPFGYGLGVYGYPYGMGTFSGSSSVGPAYLCLSAQGQFVVVSSAALTAGYTNCVPYTGY
jgi:hypothetical protein